MKLSLPVKSAKQLYHFYGEIHRADAPEKLLLHPDEFYLKEGKAPLAFPHFEIEITYPKKGDLPAPASIHLHASYRDEERLFLCWPTQINTFEWALDLFEAWAAGCVFTLVHKRDFNEAFVEAGKATGPFLSLLRDKYGIVVSPCTTMRS